MEAVRLSPLNSKNAEGKCVQTSKEDDGSRREKVHPTSNLLPSHRRDPSRDGSISGVDEHGFPVAPTSSPILVTPTTNGSILLVEGHTVDNLNNESDSFDDLDDLENDTDILTGILARIAIAENESEGARVETLDLEEISNDLKEFDREEGARAILLQNRKNVASQLVKRITRLRQSNKRIALVNMGLKVEDIPIKELQRLNRGKSMIQQYLRVLLLSGNSLDSLPTALVEEMKGLVELDLSQNNIQELPQKVKWNLVSLSTLDLSHNSLQSFLNVRAMKHLRNLRVLNLSNNQMTEFSLPTPAAFHHSSSSSSSLSTAQYIVLPNLRELNLGYNQLQHLPPQLTKWKKLRVLQVNNNLLEFISPEVVLGLQNLEVLDCRNNPMVMPPVVDAERGLAVMRRYYTALLGKEYDLSLLKEDIEGDSDEGCSPECASVTRISKTKQLRQKVRRTVSETIEAQPKIIKSKLDRHSTSGSFSKDKLKKLKKNSAKEFPRPAQIFVGHRERKDSQMILGFAPSEDFWDSSLADTRKPTIKVAVNNTLKVICVGPEGAGKSSMIRCLIEGKSSMFEDSSTGAKRRTIVSVDHIDWDPKVHLDEGAYGTPEVDSSLDGTRYPLSTAIPEDLILESEESLGGATFALRDEERHIRFSVWDCGGIEGGHCIHELVFSPRALYILAWDMGANDLKTFPLERARTPRETKKGNRLKSKFDDDDSSVSDNTDDDTDYGHSVSSQHEADSALVANIERHVQFWVDRIQAIVPGAVILPLGTFAEKLGTQEQHRRWNVLKKVLEEREKEQLNHMGQKYQEFVQTKQATLPQAEKLRTLLDPNARPRFVWLEHFNPTESPRPREGTTTPLCVSSKKYSGFETLRRCIIQLALGELPGQTFFHGHIGAILPPIRRKVQDLVMKKRKTLKVMERQHFLNILRDAEGVVPNCDEEVFDSLHFLSCVGEVSYFTDDESLTNQGLPSSVNGAPSNFDSPCIDVDDCMALKDSRHVSSFFFLNPKILFAAARAVVRPDIEKEVASFTAQRIKEHLHGQVQQDFFPPTSFNTPIITAIESALLWKADRKINKAAANCCGSVSSNSQSWTLYDFLNNLFEAFRVFVALGSAKGIIRMNNIRLKLPKNESSQDGFSTATWEKTFLIPSLILYDNPVDGTWTFKSRDSYKSTLAVSWLLPDSGGVAHLMEAVVSSVFNSLSCPSYNDTSKDASGQSEISTFHPSSNSPVKDAFQFEESVDSLEVESVTLWRSALLMQFSTKYVSRGNGNEYKKSYVDVFVCLASNDDPHHCVGSDYMPKGSKKLVASAKGQHGKMGRKIWSGGFGLVTKAIEHRVMAMPGISASKEAICCECLQKSHVSQARSWQWDHLYRMFRDDRRQVRCAEGHLVDVALLCGGLKRTAPILSPEQSASRIEHEANEILDFRSAVPNLSKSIVPVKNLIKSVVLVALWDCKEKSMVRFGSGFVVDSKCGLIVTASHTLFEMTTPGPGGRRRGVGSKFGELHFGLAECKIIVGVIPSDHGNQNPMSLSETSLWEAQYRYFAEIVQHDVENVDACVLKLTSRFENDITDSRYNFSRVAEIILKRKKKGYKKGQGYRVEEFKDQNLQALQLATRVEPEEEIRLLGYNQGGEGLFKPGTFVNRGVDFTRGYFVKIFSPPDTERDSTATKQFFPKQEYIVKCPTIGGHSGGPCVNNDGEVIGILSRVDPADPRKCYIVPFKEFIKMVSRAQTASKTRTAKSSVDIDSYFGGI